LFVDTNDDFNEWIESHSTSVDIKSSEHEKVETDCAPTQQAHLTPSQQADPVEALKDFTNLLTAHLVVIQVIKFILNQMMMQNLFTQDLLQSLINEKLPSKKSQNAWFRQEHFPMQDHTNGCRQLLQFQKKGRVQWVSDFCARNELIKHKAHAASSRVQDIL
jgi:hypothetical protein